MGLFKSVCRPAKTDPAERVLTLSLPPPVPTRKKLSTTYPKRLPLKTSPHHQCTDPGTDSLGSSHVRTNCTDLKEDSYPGRTNDHLFAPSRTRI